MTLTLRALVVVLIGIAGIAVGTFIRPVEAQTESSPFQIGQRLDLSYDNDRTFPCVLVEVRGTFVRCEQSRPDAFNRAPVWVLWYNTASTVSISVREK